MSATAGVLFSLLLPVEWFVSGHRWSICLTFSVQRQDYFSGGNAGTTAAHIHKVNLLTLPLQQGLALSASR